MMLSEILNLKNISKYRLSKNTGIPYMTINDICNDKTRLEKCSAETAYRIARELQISTDELLEPYMHKRINFELYKSNVCHKLKELGDIPFLIETLEDNEIRTLYERQWYPESLYLLAMVDYISNENAIPLCADYNDLRKCCLSEVLYPVSILTIAAATKDSSIKDQARRQAIPEFMRYNIVESEVRDVI